MGSVKGKRLSKRLSVKGKRLSGKVKRLSVKGRRMSKRGKRMKGLRVKRKRLSVKNKRLSGKPLPSMAQLAESGRKLLAEPQEADATETNAAAATPGTYREIEVKCTDGHWYKAMLLEYDEGEEECEIYFPDPESDLAIHPDLMIRPVAKRYD